MSKHPLSMKDKLSKKTRPVTSCRIFVGDPEEYRTTTQEKFMPLLKFFGDNSNEMDNLTAEQRRIGIKLMEAFSESQEPFFQTFRFKAMKPVPFERLADEYPPREGTEDVAFNYDTFPRRIFQECMIEPAYKTLSEEEWDEFLENCSQKERRLLFDTAMNSNLRNVEPSTPKDLMTRS